jgi:hypothetical protein
MASVLVHLLPDLVLLAAWFGDPRTRGGLARSSLMVKAVRTTFMMVIVMLSAAASRTTPPSAHAQPQPTLEAMPASGAPGETIALRGSGWPAGSTLVARMYEASNVGGPGADLGMAFQTDANGSFSAEGTVPRTFFGPSSRGNLSVVPGGYTIVVRSGPEPSASAPFSVTAPRDGVLLWGEAAFDTNANGQRDSADLPAAVAAEVSVTSTRIDLPAARAITDARGRYLFSPLEPGFFYLNAQAQFRGAAWEAKATASAADREAARVDLLLQPSAPTIDEQRCAAQTGFCVDSEAFWSYFIHRGGVRTLGYPISRTFVFLGYRTQFFQRLVLQEAPAEEVRSLNLLDPGLLPYTRINGSQFPPVMEEVKAATPPVGSPDYDTNIVDFVRQQAPNVLASGEQVGFYDAFRSTVSCQDAYPESDCPDELLPLLNLEIWGAPISRPTDDPTNAQFVYLRFQRGILHYQGQDAQGNPITEGILLADWFKSLITGEHLPPDLEAQAEADRSRYLRQYCPDRPSWVCRPDELLDTDLSFAFEPQ